MRNISTVTRKGQVTIPIEIRRRLGIEVGDQVEFVESATGFEVARVAPKQTMPVGSLFASLPPDDPIRLAAGSLANYAKPHLTIEERHVAKELAIEQGWTARERRDQDLRARNHD